MDAVVTGSANRQPFSDYAQEVAMPARAVMDVLAPGCCANLTPGISQQEYELELFVLLELSSPFFADSFEWGAPAQR